MYADEEVHSGSPGFEGLNQRGLKTLDTPNVNVNGCNTPVDENLNSFF